MQRTGDEFPERLEILELRPGRILVVGGSIVHIGRQPDGVGDAGILDVAQQFGKFEFAAGGRRENKQVIVLVPRTGREICVMA
jgi:hypothetical protein